MLFECFGVCFWRDFEKSVQSKSKAKAPVVYAGIGFVLGLLFALGIAIIIGFSMYSDVQKPEFEQQNIKLETSDAPVSIVPSETNEEVASQTTGSEEKYTVKAGDTLDKIAYRF